MSKITQEQILGSFPHRAERIKSNFLAGLEPAEVLADIAALDSHEALLVARSALSKVRRMDEVISNVTQRINALISAMEGPKP